VTVRLNAAAADPLGVAADVLAVPVFKGGIEGPGAAPALQAAGLETLPRTPAFRGDIGQTLLIGAPGLAAGALLFVGLGRMDETDSERLRRAAACAVRAVPQAQTIVTTLAEVHPTGASIGAVGEGLLLGAYDDSRFRTAAGSGHGPAALAEATVLVPSSRLRDAAAALQRAERYARATCVARDLVNLPPDRKQPHALAARIEEAVGAVCQVRVHDAAVLRRAGYGGLLAVGGGSASPPCLVELRYRPRNPLGHVALVGKGITFDSGGLSLKRPDEMAEMKSDMAGAAAVVGACSALADLDVRLEVTALLPLAENLPSGAAQRPGDVYTAYGGTTVEVLDTDAEGRLVLADALAAASERGVDAVIDLATLTGAAIGAVGRYAAALFGTDPDLVDALDRAAGIAGEPVTRLPLWADLERFLASDVADVRNIADTPRTDPGGGAITAALFLRRFVGETPWAHLDIAGPAFLPPALADHYLPAGGTGFGVRTLLAWLERRG
jgi:leucyl aminopeptidase